MPEQMLLNLPLAEGDTGKMGARDVKKVPHIREKEM